MDKKRKEEIENIIDDKIGEHEDSSFAHSDWTGAVMLFWLLILTAVLFGLTVAPHIKLLWV